MVIFRRQQGGLADSMRTVRKFETMQELKNYLAKELKDCIYDLHPEDPEDVEIDEEVVDDTRIGWHDCKTVCIPRLYVFAEWRLVSAQQNLTNNKKSPMLQTEHRGFSNIHPNALLREAGWICWYYFITHPVFYQ